MRRFLPYLGPALTVTLLTAAVWTIQNEMSGLSYEDIRTSLHAIRPRRLIMAMLFTVANYLLLTSYDALAVKYVGRKIDLARVAVAAFIGNAFSNTVGFSLLSGSSIRYRLYAAWGLGAVEIAMLVVFTTISLWLGLAAFGGLALVNAPLSTLANAGISPVIGRVAGIGLLALVGVYMAACALRRTPVELGGFSLRLPSLRIALPQLFFSLLDWALAGAVLYVLLVSRKTPLSFWGFLESFILAQFAGLLSQIPGGLGVFESVLVLFLPPEYPRPKIFAVLLAYRIIYYFIPLSAAAALLGGQELLRSTGRVGLVAQRIFAEVPRVTPQILAVLVFLGGVVLLFSGATPAVEWRLDWLELNLPDTLVETAHFLASLLGLGLLVISRGLQLRLDAAYWAALVLLGLGVVMSMLKGLDFEEATLLLGLMAVLAPNHRHFFRRASLFAERFTPGWVAAFGLAMLATGWLVWFSFQNDILQQEAWWHFTLEGEAPRAIRVAVAVAVTALVITLYLLVDYTKYRPVAGGEDLELSVRDIVDHSRSTHAHLALLGDKEFIVSESSRSFIMYGVEGRSFVAMGDPVGEESEFQELAWRFKELSSQYGGRPVFYQVGSQYLPLYLDMGLTLLKLGEEARVFLPDFSLDGAARKNMRNTRNRMEKEGCSFEIVEAAGVADLMPELENVSNAWLASKKTREKRFSLGGFDPAYLMQSPLAIVRREGAILAFANLWQGAEREELSMDLMRYTENAPENIMEYLLIKLLLWGKENGYRWFNLGMAPFSGLQSHTLTTVWNRFGAFLFEFGEHFYNFQGLRRFKEKFDPVWTPKYLAAPSGLALPRVLANVAFLVSGGLRGVVSK